MGRFLIRCSFTTPPNSLLIDQKVATTMAHPSSSTSGGSRTHRHPYSFFSLCHEDLLHNILRRLPAPSFALAACVCKTWHRVSNQILSRPLLASAVSLNPSPQGALLEVLNKVLSNPVRPHFAIINVANDCDLSRMLELTSKRLGTTTPIIVSCSGGLIGKDASTDEIIEVQRGDDNNGVCGVALTVGFIPGLKVDAIPLTQLPQEPIMVDKFVMDIRQFSTSVSGEPLPIGIMIFGDGRYDLKHAIEKLDYAMPIETAIVGDERGRFAYQTVDQTRGFRSPGGGHGYIDNAVALTFARDRNNIHGVGETNFHVALSEGISAQGPIYKAASVRTSDRATWLTAKREGTREILDGERMMMNVDEELKDLDLYIGVTKRRKYAIGSVKAGLVTSLSFHSIFRADEEYLYVEGHGIRTGDHFQFYAPDAAVASSTCDEVHTSLEKLNLSIPDDCCHGRAAPSANSGVKKEEVFGGFIFSCCGRGEHFLGRQNADSSPFTGNFPGVPLTGVFCGGEIGRRSISLVDQNPERATPVSVCSHVYSSVYLVMTYTPPTQGQEAGH